MASFSLTMPQLGESVTEGVIGGWLKQPGDEIRRDEPVVEIITDKVNAELPSPVAGVLERILAPVGSAIAVGDVIASITIDGDVSSASASNSPGGRASNAPVEAKPDPAVAVGVGEPRSSPLVRRLAREHGIDLKQLRGTGAGGRISRDDVEEYLRQRQSMENAAAAPPLAAAMPTAATPAFAPVTSASTTAREQSVPASPIRRAIAEHMTQSARAIPHAWLMLEVDVTRLGRLREQQADRFEQTEQVRLTYLPFVLKAAAETLREYPIVNSTWTDGQILIKPRINLGVAVALERGLTVPILHDADQQSVAGLERVMNSAGIWRDSADSGIWQPPRFALPEAAKVMVHNRL